MLNNTRMQLVSLYDRMKNCGTNRRLGIAKSNLKIQGSTLGKPEARK